MLIVGTGAAIFALTYFSFGKKILTSFAGKVIVSVAAIAAAILAVLN
jgi:hypothetical protein